MTSWDGRERRNGVGKDHDLLTRIDANLINFLIEFKSHVIDDNKNFEEHDKRIKSLEKVFWCGVGVVLVLQVLLKFIR